MKIHILFITVISILLLSTACISGSALKSGAVELKTFPELYAEAFDKRIQDKLPGRVVVTAEKYDLSDKGIVFGKDTRVLRILCTPTDAMIFPIEFYITEQGPASYAISAESYPEIDLFCVTPLVYVFLPMRVDTGSFVLHSEISTLFEEVIESSRYTKTLRDYLDAKVPADFRPLQVEEKRAAVAISVALPGSHIPDDDILSSLAPGKALILTSIPDTGPLRVRIIPPEKTAEQTRLDEELKAVISSVKINSTETEKIRTVKQKIEELGKRPFPGAAQKAESAKELLYRRIGIESGSLEFAFIDSYTEKATPDTYDEYRPGAGKLMKSVPEAALKNLAALLLLFDTVTPEALAAPGKYEDGPVMLGADTKQYVPSDEELVLSEIGNRIAAIVSATTVQERKAEFGKAGIGRKSISYKKITFRHVDVMGSGRFFYANEPEKVTVVLQ